ncbi:uncharacterized protein FOMMEDRAFT_100544 [Fomitiporia mediterranea MF3/22]|uniref:uncharacterized protein n=1 Tax=Fomitiporia mediterranea (strain MF3/22) TaxID=694068 RepID=UPI00044092EA|nr:uncharacterized protein FOMMEDRAFT_100544 [Fomitiporia mediterranea MF3/22]EJD07353.1 hypothetical protein FOMMEDRAFT_100544 [Fomitiporia mediterranea MF3/22]
MSTASGSANTNTNANASKSLSQSQSGQQPQGQGSRRWTHFHSALQLAIQRASHKWTYEDFSECFELWCKEEPDGASGVYNTISLHMERLITDACEELFERYNARENIDKLHAVVTEARERKQAGLPPGPDTWKPNLEPRTAVRARTIPILQREKAALEKKLGAMEEENLELQREIIDNVDAMKRNVDEEQRQYDFLDELDKRWHSLPIEDMQELALRNAETLASQTASAS